MGLLDLASNNSFWRGYDYFVDNKVQSCQKIDAAKYEGIVAGSEGNQYHVLIDLEHPKKSKCDCPHAEGSRRVCKHKVALYFFRFPDEAERVIKEAEEWEAEEEQQWQEESEEIWNYVKSLSKKELQNALYNMMIEQMEEDYF